MDTGTVAMITVISGILGGFLMKAGEFVWGLIGRNDAKDEKDRQNTLNDYKDLLKRQDARIEEQERRIRKLEITNLECHKERVQAITWIKSVKKILEDKGLSVPDWLDSPLTDTGSHPPLPPSEVHYGDG